MKHLLGFANLRCCRWTLAESCLDAALKEADQIAQQLTRVPSADSIDDPGASQSDFVLFPRSSSLPSAMRSICETPSSDNLSAGLQKSTSHDDKASVESVTFQIVMDLVKAQQAAGKTSAAVRFISLSL